MVKIINHNTETKTYKDYVIGAGSILELPKEDAKAFIRTFEGVDWIRTEEAKKKEVVKSVSKEIPQVEIVGERGDI